MLINIFMLMAGACTGVTVMSCLTIDRINEEKRISFLKGFEKGRAKGIAEEKMRSKQ